MEPPTRRAGLKSTSRVCLRCNATIGEQPVQSTSLIITQTSFHHSYHCLFTLCPGDGCEVLWWVCLSVCLSTRITQKPHGRTISIFCACCLWHHLLLQFTILVPVLLFSVCPWIPWFGGRLLVLLQSVFGYPSFWWQKLKETGFKIFLRKL